MNENDEFSTTPWDQQMEADAQNGNLDRLCAALQRENAAQPEIPIDDYLDEIEVRNGISCHRATPERAGAAENSLRPAVGLLG